MPALGERFVFEGIYNITSLKCTLINYYLLLLVTHIFKFKKDFKQLLFYQHDTAHRNEDVLKHGFDTLYLYVLIK